MHILCKKKSSGEAIAVVLLQYPMTSPPFSANWMKRRMAGLKLTTMIAKLWRERPSRMWKMPLQHSRIKWSCLIWTQLRDRSSKVRLFTVDGILAAQVILIFLVYSADLKLESTETGEFWQTEMFEGVLKHYQLKGLNWLASFHNQVCVGDNLPEVN